MPNIDDEIRSKLEAFAADLTALVRRLALEAVIAALGTGAAVAVAVTAPAAAKRGRGRPRKAAAPAPAAVPAAKAAKGRPTAKAAKAAPAAKAPVSKRPAAPKRAPGAKRPPAELAKLTEKLGEYIKAHPGQRVEAIGKALGAPTKELTLPIKKLLAAKKIRSEGLKRATEYFPA